MTLPNDDAHPDPGLVNQGSLLHTRQKSGKSSRTKMVPINVLKVVPSEGAGTMRLSAELAKREVGERIRWRSNSTYPAPSAMAKIRFWSGIAAQEVYPALYPALWRG